MTKWRTKTLTGRCSGQCKGVAAHRLFEAPRMHEACRLGMHETVLEKILEEECDGDVNALDPAGRTSLHFAVGYGRVTATRFLLAKGA